MSHRLLVIAIAWLVSGSPALADLVVLKDGTRLVGRAEVDGRELRLRGRLGAIAYPMDEVAEVTPDLALREEHRSRKGELKPGDVEALLALADWADDVGLADEATADRDEAVQAAPENPAARTLRGEVKRNGAWIRRADLEAQGLVEYRGAWIPRRERDKRVARARIAWESQRRAERERIRQTKERLRAEWAARREAAAQETAARPAETGSSWGSWFRFGNARSYPGWVVPGYGPGSRCGPYWIPGGNDAIIQILYKSGRLRGSLGPNGSSR